MGNVDGSEGFFPLAEDPQWHHIKDLALTLLLQRAVQTGNIAHGDVSDRRFLAALSRLSPASERRDATLAAIFDLGCDLGRHIYSKSLLEDSFAEGLGALAKTLDRVGAGRFETERLFHRTATLTFVAVGEMRSCDPSVRAAYLAGVLTGALGEAHNCRVHVAMSAGDHYEVTLGEGRDVNQEVAGHA